MTVKNPLVGLRHFLNRSYLLFFSDLFFKVVLKMSAIEKEVTKYMITTDSGSSEAIEAAENLVKSTNYVAYIRETEKGS